MASKEKNLVIVRSVLDQGMTVKTAATKFGTSPQWINTLIRRYQTNGPAGLEPQSRAAKTSPHTTNQIIEARIIELRKSLTINGSDNGPETIKWHLEKEGLHAPAISTIRRILHRAGLITPEPRKRPRNSYIRFQAELPNECWQSDITHWFLADGTRVEILDFLDDHSRALLHLEAKTAFKGSDIVTAMQNLINTHGAPASTLTDNGLVFTTRLATWQGAKNGFEKLLEANQIDQKNGKPNHPQTQGKVERFHQTLKKWLKARPRPKSINELQQMLDEFKNWYNNERPHRSIGRKTPTEAYEALPKATPAAKADNEYRTRNDKVDKHGSLTIRYAGKLRHLGIGRAHNEKPVLMLVKDNHVVVSDANNGEILGEFLIDPTKDYQAKIKNKPSAHNQGKTDKSEMPR